MTILPHDIRVVEKDENQNASMRRSVNLDILRILSCAAVVMLHVSARTIYLHEEVGSLSWGAANLINSFTRWCVPEFVMLSGALLLREPIRNPVNFLKRRSTRIVIPIVFWSSIYLCWRTFWHRESLDTLALGKEVFQGFPYYHLYFLFVIAGLYIFAPPIAAALRGLSYQQSLGFALTALLISSLTMTLQGLNGNALTQFVPYVGYFMLGALLFEVSIPLWISATIFLAAGLSTVLLTIWSVSIGGVNGNWGLYFYSYFNPTVLLMAPALFCYINRLSVTNRLALLAEKLSALTLGLYLLHPMILEIIRNVYAGYAPFLLWPIFDVPLTFVLTLVVTGFIVVVLRRIPVLRLTV